jgi:hypothetical protein
MHYHIFGDIDHLYGKSYIHIIKAVSVMMSVKNKGLRLVGILCSKRHFLTIFYKIITLTPDRSEVDAPRERGHRQDPVQQAGQATHDLHPAAALGHHRRSATVLNSRQN